MNNIEIKESIKRDEDKTDYYGHGYFLPTNEIKKIHLVIKNHGAQYAFRIDMISTKILEANYE